MTMLPGTESTDELSLRRRQQELAAHFATFALRASELQPTLDELCRVVAAGLRTDHAKVLEWQPATGRLLVRAGVGWRPGVVGHATLGADDLSPAGYAFQTGQAVISDHLEDETRFRTPALLAEHGIHSAINVLVGDEGRRFGVLEADASERKRFTQVDSDFLQGLASTLGLVVERLLQTQRLRDNEAFLASVLNASPDVIKVIAGDGRVEIIGAGAAEKLEAGSTALLVGRQWEEAWPAEEAVKVRAAVAAGAAGQSSRFEAFRITPLGNPRWWDVRVAPIPGEPPRLVAVLRDITALQDNVRQKDLLMLEVHHRVKNSLQLVQNLLSLQARGAATAEAAQQLTESANRVLTIGAIHDQLYRTGAALEVDVPGYLAGLMAHVRSGMASTLERAVVVDCDPLVWPAAEVTTLGLVVTELLTNALKYGEGAIRITVRDRDGDQIELTVDDEGPGVPADFDPARSKGLGMRLIRGLLRGGTIEADRSVPHTRFIVHIPHPRQGIVPPVE
ncbi:sensor histidine kinase [Roseomonas elaeocarpi]|uniref:histidine kinase n=1 Tax=Roseomonas elaeocarpi TaxID=907779 RepID=A0ABV6JPW9_9PROT